MKILNYRRGLLICNGTAFRWASLFLYSMETILNKLTPIKFLERDKHGDRWLFECECGKQVNRVLYKVKKGLTTHCGCSRKSVPKVRKSQEQYLKEVTERHNNFYSYSKTIYTKNEDKIIITCPNHGDFEQRASNHLLGIGCKDCGMEVSGYSKSAYIKQAKDRESIMYILRCFNENEEFYKIGRTFLSVKSRYKRPGGMPYTYEVVYEYRGDAGCIWEGEKEHHRKYKSFQYFPNIKFTGQTECFSTELPLEEIIHSLQK